MCVTSVPTLSQAGVIHNGADVQCLHSLDLWPILSMRDRKRVKGAGHQAVCYVTMDCTEFAGSP